MKRSKGRNLRRCYPVNHGYGVMEQTLAVSGKYSFPHHPEYQVLVLHGGGLYQAIFNKNQLPRVHPNMTTDTENKHAAGAHSNTSNLISTDADNGNARVSEARTSVAGDDFVFGNTADNDLEGRVGDDALFGRLGNVSLLGGEGNDILDGGPGPVSSLSNRIK